MCLVVTCCFLPALQDHSFMQSLLIVALPFAGRCQFCCSRFLNVRHLNFVPRSLSYIFLTRVVLVLFSRFLASLLGTDSDLLGTRDIHRSYVFDTGILFYLLLSGILNERQEETSFDRLSKGNPLGSVRIPLASSQHHNEVCWN